MVLASRIPSYETRLRCADIMQSFAPDAEFTTGRLMVVDEAITQVHKVGFGCQVLGVGCWVLGIGYYIRC